MHDDPKQHETGPSEEEEELLRTEELLGGGGVLEKEEGSEEEEGTPEQVGQPQPVPLVSHPLLRGSPIVVPGGQPLHAASQHDRDPVSSPNVCLHQSHRLVEEVLEALLTVLLREEGGELPALELGGGGGVLEKADDREDEGGLGEELEDEEEDEGGLTEDEDREEEEEGLSEDREDAEEEEQAPIGVWSHISPPSAAGMQASLVQGSPSSQSGGMHSLGALEEGGQMEQSANM